MDSRNAASMMRLALAISAAIVLLCVAFYIWSIWCRKQDIKRLRHYYRSTRWMVAGFKRPRPGRELLN
jgi:hypothetical protein